MPFQIRQAVLKDLPRLTRLMADSIRGLHTGDYTQAQVERGLESHYGIDSMLIADGTYFVVEEDGVLAGCGGWSRRRTLSGGDQAAERDDSPLDPAHDAARIRAFFVHPLYARRGVGSLILETCEAAAMAEGFARLEMGATLTGVPFYLAHGYRECERFDIPLAAGEVLPVVRMEKTVANRSAAR